MRGQAREREIPMSKAKPLPKIGPCPSGCKSARLHSWNAYWVECEHWVTRRNYRTRLAAINAWNRRAKDSDAERRGAMAAWEWISQRYPMAASSLGNAIDHGEVLRSKSKETP